MREISGKIKNKIDKYRAMTDLALMAGKGHKAENLFVKEYCDIRYSKYGKYGLLDVYKPFGYDGRIPVIVHTHGGAYCYGSKEMYRDYCKSLSGKGFAVINYNYRLFYEYGYPDPLYDLNSVLDWLEKNSSEYFFDTEKVFLAGDSAGANNTFLYLVIRSAGKYESFLGSKPSRVRIQGALLNCGFYDVITDYSSDIFGVDLIEEYFGDSDNIPEILSEAKKMLDERFPPCYVMTSNDDFLKQDSYDLREALEQKAIKFVFKEYGTDDNRLKHVFHIDISNETAGICNSEECEFLKEL